MDNNIRLIVDTAIQHARDYGLFLQFEMHGNHTICLKSIASYHGVNIEFKEYIDLGGVLSDDIMQRVNEAVIRLYYRTGDGVIV